MTNDKFIRLKSFSVLKYIDFSHKSWNQIRLVKERLKFSGSIEVVMYSNVDEISKLIGVIVPDWVVGLSYGRTIYMKKPELWGDSAFGNFTETLIHEIFHTIVGDALNFSLPIWLNEGMAINIASQTKYLSPPPSYDEDIAELGYDNPYLYQISAYKVQGLIEKIGLELMLDSMKNGRI